MIRLGFMVRELGRSLYRNPGTALGSVLSLTLLFLLFNIFWVAAGTSEAFYRDLLSELRMEAFINEDLPDSAATSLTKEIYAIDGIVSAAYVSKQQARAELADQLGIDLLVGYDSLNPLPRSYVLTMEPQVLNSGDMQRISEQLTLIPGIDDVAYSRRFLEKAETTRGLILQVGLGLGAIILLTALITSSNSIRLMTRARAVGFRQMMLLGASKSFVGMPFIIEGLLIGGLSAIFSWVIVLYGHSRVVFTQITIVLPSREDMILFCAAAALVGCISGFLGIRRSLK
ncbi:MAG: permease-like cell division protein FtsX [candidate division Zixibacteria bacterium]|nr:permease-like cell division protein FtsX [candidate division Zixibacteria bacterium]